MRFAMNSRVAIFSIFSIFSMLIVVLALSSAPLSAKAPAAASNEGKITLTYDSGKSVTCLTPNWVSGSGSARVMVKTSIVKVAVGGHQIAAAGWASVSDSRIGLDSDGDGIVGAKEYQKVAPGGSTVLTGKADGKEMAVRCVDVHLHYDAKKKEVAAMRWRMQGVYGWVGEIDSVKIRIMDEDMDGKYGQNGGGRHPDRQGQAGASASRAASNRRQFLRPEDIARRFEPGVQAGRYPRGRTGPDAV